MSSNLLSDVSFAPELGRGGRSDGKPLPFRQVTSSVGNLVS